MAGGKGESPKLKAKTAGLRTGCSNEVYDANMLLFSHLNVSIGRYSVASSWYLHLPYSKKIRIACNWGQEKIILIQFKILLYAQYPKPTQDKKQDRGQAIITWNDHLFLPCPYNDFTDHDRNTHLTESGYIAVSQLAELYGRIAWGLPLIVYA